MGAGRILPAHLRGYQLLREAGFDRFRITALTSRSRRDAESYIHRDREPAPRRPVSSQPADPLSVADVFVSDFQNASDVRVFDTLEELLASDTVDALDITATLSVHHTAALAGIRAGKHCLIQKPLAISVAAGRRVVDEARRQGVSLGVTENVRYAPNVRMARWLIDQGYLGEVQMLAYWSIGTAEWSPDLVVAETPWRHRKLEGGAGASLDIGVHLLHHLRYVAGDIDSIQAVTRTFEPTRHVRGAAARIACDVDDAFFATIAFASGAVAQLAFSWAGHGVPTTMPGGPAIYGSRGSLKGGTLTFDDGSTLAAADLFGEKADPHTVERFFPRGLRDTFSLGFHDFLSAIDAGRDPEASGREGLADLAAAYGIAESATLGHPVSVRDVLEGRVRAYQADIDRHYDL
ncbi:MAG TPA: Gfo/Idh/MocA family oxidoreductase [Chloroflexota bacterium]|nr:Gfo/Idh/MocA family oxidoreductase [Chloroflexota bacterium]